MSMREIKVALNTLDYQLQTLQELLNRVVTHKAQAEIYLEDKDYEAALTEFESALYFMQKLKKEL